MSNQNNTTISERIKSKEIVELLERPLKKRDIDAIEKRLTELEEIFSNI